MTLSLHDDVFVAHADGMLVFLDLAGDRYCALDRAWSRRTIEAHAAGRDDCEVVGRLRRARLSGDAAQAPFRLTEHPSAETDLAAKNARVGPFSVAHAALCRLYAARLLRRRHIGEIVAMRRADRERWRTTPPPRAERLVEQARRFNASSVFAPRGGACLERALALLFFLGRAGAGVDWVFAVKAAPFSAHCWIQCGRVVLNDSLENTAGYAPIMVA